MNWNNRAIVALIAVAVAVGAYTRQAWAENLGLDVWNVPHLHLRLENQKRVGCELDERVPAALQRALRRAAVVESLINGHLSFATAIDVNLELAQSDEASRHYLHRHFSGHTEREKSAHQLLEQVRNASNPQGKTVAEQLQSEMATMTFE